MMASRWKTGGGNSRSMVIKDNQDFLVILPMNHRVGYRLSTEVFVCGQAMSVEDWAYSNFLVRKYDFLPSLRLAALYSLSLVVCSWAR